MNLEQIREYCLSKPAVSESFPFDETALVFKVADKMFALIGLDSKQINLKCDPERAIELREEYEFIIPGYHMSKKHWNTIVLEECTEPWKFISELIDHSYHLVYNGLPKKVRMEIEKDK